MAETEIQHVEGTFKAAKGVELYQQWWTPSGEIKGFVVLCHGIAEHSGRYNLEAQFLCERGYSVGGFDLRNHGRSGDHTIFVDRFDDYLADLDVFLARARTTAREKPLFLLGHSMGGTIVTLYTITRQPTFLKGLVLSAPAVKLGNDISPLLVLAGGVLSVLTPRLKVVKIDASSISHDPQVMKRYDNDPLNYRDMVPARTGAELSNAIQRIQADMEAISLPILILHGTQDRLADINGSRALFQRVSSVDKTFKSYEGYYHEVMHEIGREVVLTDIADWLDLHV